jgi:hypothetical protein
VNDSESFPARIQSRLSDWKVENHAVVGYGTAQHWLQLQSLIERSQPDMVILSFSSVHFIRTILDQKYRANLKIGYRRSNAQVDERMQGARFPYFDGCKTAPKYASWETMYTEFPGRYWSASLNFIHGILERNRNASCDPVEVTACLIQEMHELCKKRNISFAVVCLNSTHETKKLEAKLDGVNWKNVGFSFKRRSWTHLPYDSHPNANGHQFIANVVFPFLNALMYEAN